MNIIHKYNARWTFGQSGRVGANFAPLEIPNHFAAGDSSSRSVARFVYTTTPSIQWFIVVLFLQTGHNIHSSLFIQPAPCQNNTDTYLPYLVTRELRQGAAVDWK